MVNQTSVLSHELYEVKEAIEYLWVYNVSCATTTQEIVNYFEDLVGPIEYFNMDLDENAADCLCKIEIVFRCANDARKALLLYDGTQFHGRHMVLKLFVDGLQIFPEQIVFPGSVIHLPTHPQELPVESFGKSQYNPAPEQEYPPSDNSGQNYTCLFVTNLNYSTNGKRLLDFFEKTVGPVESIGMYLDDNGFLCGKAQVIFRRPEDSYTAVLRCNGTLFDGRLLMVKLYVNGQRMRASQILLPESPSTDDWLRPHVPFVSLPSTDCMAEYFPEEPIVGPFTMPTMKEGADGRKIYPEGPGYPPFLPFVYVKDCIRPYVPPVLE